VSLLQADVSLGNARVRLGLQNIQITQRHYNPWVRTWHEGLGREIMRVFEIGDALD
jgi:hypothetical protein